MNVGFQIFSSTFISQTNSVPQYPIVCHQIWSLIVEINLASSSVVPQHWQAAEVGEGLDITPKLKNDLLTRVVFKTSLFRSVKLESEILKSKAIIHPGVYNLLSPVIYVEKKTFHSKLMKGKMVSHTRMEKDQTAITINHNVQALGKSADMFDK